MINPDPDPYDHDMTSDTDTNGYCDNHGDDFGHDDAHDGLDDPPNCDHCDRKGLSTYYVSQFQGFSDPLSPPCQQSSAIA